MKTAYVFKKCFYICKVLLIKKKAHEKYHIVNCVKHKLRVKLYMIVYLFLGESQNAVLLRSFVVLATRKYEKEGSVHWVEWHGRVKISAIKSNGSDN